MANKRFTEADLLKKGYIPNKEGNYGKGQVFIEPKPQGKKNREQNQLETYQVNQNVEANDIVLQWVDKHVSLNEWYSSSHWNKRDKAKKDWYNFFVGLLPKPLIKFSKYSIILEYNSRLDPSNTITMVKILEDTIQDLGMIENDNKDYCNSILLMPNKLMKHNSYRIIIKSL